MTHNTTIILYYTGLHETMFFRVDKRDGYSFDKHGNQWRMINGELQYFTGNRYEKDNAMQWGPVRVRHVK